MFLCTDSPSSSTSHESGSHQGISSLQFSLVSHCHQGSLVTLVQPLSSSSPLQLSPDQPVSSASSRISSAAARPRQPPTSHTRSQKKLHIFLRLYISTASSTSATTVANDPTAPPSPSSVAHNPTTSITPSHRARPHSQSLSPNAAEGASTANPRLPSPTFQPPYPTPSPVPTSSREGRERPQPQVRVTSPTRWSLRNALIGGGNPDYPSPFRSRLGSAGVNTSTTANTSRPLRARRQSPARLWNPTNSTPRAPRRKRTTPQAQEENPAVIAIPLSHPDIGSPREGAAAGGSYPLLTLSEQRQSLHLGSARASLQVDRSGSSAGSNRVSLPRSVSIDISRSKNDDSPTTPEIKLDKGKGRATSPELAEAPDSSKPEHKKVKILRQRGQSTSKQPPSPGLSFHHDMSTDLERGPVTPGLYSPGGNSTLPNNASNVTLDAGIGPALGSETSSIIGTEGGVAQDEWGPQHPCFPHMNSHVPLSSPLYQTTRIIRIRRDWMIEGDLAPTFSNLYPEILDPAGVTEQDFRAIIEKVNNELLPAFNPLGARNIFDGVMGLLTGWIWDDLGFSDIKARLRKVEDFLEEWNREMEKKSKDPGSAPRIMPLRRTGYMNLDIQVPDPEISYPASNTDRRTVTGNSQNSQQSSRSQRVA